MLRGYPIGQHKTRRCLASSTPTLHFWTLTLLEPQLMKHFDISLERLLPCISRSLFLQAEATQHPHVTCFSMSQGHLRTPCQIPALGQALSQTWKNDVLVPAPKELSLAGRDMSFLRVCDGGEWVQECDIHTVWEGQGDSLSWESL